LQSPTTTSALNENLFPPFTTFVTRPIKTTISCSGDARFLKIHIIHF